MFDHYIDLPFEGRMFKAVADWDLFLRQQYGDYMQIPPANKQITHELQVYLK